MVTATPSKATTNDRLTKTDLVDQVAERLDMTKTDTKRVLDAMLEVITESLSNQVKVSITGFGSFESKLYKARKGVNPRTGEKLQIPATYRPTFSAGAALKRAVKGE
jgi:nucleoid DNA-binding protein